MRGMTQAAGWILVGLSLWQGASLGQVMMAGDVRLQGTISGHSVLVGGHVQGEECRLQGSIRAGGQIRLSLCQTEGALQAGQGVTLIDSAIGQGVMAGGLARLQKARVGGDVMAPRVNIADSTIGGILHAAGPELTVQDSQVGGIVMHASPNRVRHGGSRVRIGQSGMSWVNGFRVHAAGGHTEVTTPEGWHYRDGRRISTDGPKTYADYQRQHAQAPQVEGPGWVSDELTGEATETPQVVRLTGHTTVLGDIRFEQGKGRVLVGPNSTVSGQVIHGIMEELR